MEFYFDNIIDRYRVEYVYVTKYIITYIYLVFTYIYIAKNQMPLIG